MHDSIMVGVIGSVDTILEAIKRNGLERTLEQLHKAYKKKSDSPHSDEKVWNGFLKVLGDVTGGTYEK